MAALFVLHRNASLVYLLGFTQLKICIQRLTFYANWNCNEKVILKSFAQLSEGDISGWGCYQFGRAGLKIYPLLKNSLRVAQFAQPIQPKPASPVYREAGGRLVGYIPCQQLTLIL